MYRAAANGDPPAQRMTIAEIKKVISAAAPISIGPRHHGIDDRSVNRTFIARFRPSIRQFFHVMRWHCRQLQLLSRDTSQQLCQQVLKLHLDLR